MPDRFNLLSFAEGALAMIGLEVAFCTVAFCTVAFFWLIWRAERLKGPRT